MSKIYLSLLLLLIPIRNNFSQADKIVPENAQLEKLFDGAFFAEGPAYNNDGCIYFSDLTFTDETGMQAGIIWKYIPELDTTIVFRSPSGMSNGIVFDLNGNMIVCEGADFGGRRITSTDMKTGKSKILTGLYNGLPYNSPNDLTVDSKNRIYFTDPRYVGSEKVEQPCFGVYRLDNDGSVTLLISDVIMPNGIAISPDEAKMYIGCNFEGDPENGISPIYSIYVYNLDTNGNVSSGKIFIKYSGETAPDGITIDKDGNLYVAIRDEISSGIYIYNPGGQLIDQILLPEVPSNLSFGKGTDKNNLYITAGGNLYRINLLSGGID